MRIDLKGRPIAISGASSGIGEATALACARAGMPVTLAARRIDRLTEIAERIQIAGGRAIAVACDVCDPQACREVIARTEAEFGTVYAVFANAGYAYEGEALDDEAKLRRLLEVNFFGSLNLIRPAMEIMRSQGRGHAIFCSSCLSKVALPYYAAYTSSKAMQEHFARAMRMELRGSGIHVSSVHPVSTRTELWDRLSEESGGETMADGGGDRRMQGPEKVARAVVRCLRHPRGEVWTGILAHAGFGLCAAMPGLAERVIAMRTRKRQADMANRRRGSI